MYDKIDKTQYTPMMRQYLDIKENYQDSLVFFRLGDFYEMFFNDAIIASKELEIVLTGRDAGAKERVPMCGVPFHSVDGYIERLTEKGYKIAIVEQLELPGDKKIVKREVTRVVTPGTKMDEKSLDEKNNNYIACLEKFNNNYCLAYIELTTGDALVTEFSSIEIAINQINKLSIKEVVVDKHFPTHYRTLLNKVYGVLVSEVAKVELESYQDNLFLNIKNDYLSACSRLVYYIVNTQKRVLFHLKPFENYTNKDYLGLDISAVKNLELIESLKGAKNKNNLFSVLDQCSTAMGSRYLKRSILFPLVNLSKINNRLDVVEIFYKNTIYTKDLHVLLNEIYDLERIVGRISYGSVSPKDLIQLRNSLKVLPSIIRQLRVMRPFNKSNALTTLINQINPFEELHDLLERSINEDAPYLLRDGNIIKPGFSDELDKIKNIGKTNKDFLINLEQAERERTGIKNLKVGFNKVFGYYIEITKSYLHLVKDEYGYIRKQTTSNSERYITQDLKERETSILRSEEISLELEIKLFNDIRNICKDNLKQLQDVATVISEIDMLHSLALVAIDNNYVRPEFSLYDEMYIEEGRHPVIETFGTKEFIPNDTSLSNNEKIVLITGPNMSGKSTFMRQNALIAIMAQMGSFVPAKYAKIPIFDQIFTRIGSGDDITSGESTFMSEMLEVNFALQNATERSMIIFDEVGRGTATFDGMALAQAIIEHIHDNIGCKTFFSTHYHELTSLEESLLFLCNVHVEAIANEETGELVFLHKVLSGSTDQSYGINVANLANIPLTVTLRAKDILEKIKLNNKVDKDLLKPIFYQKPVIIDKTPKSLLEIKEELQKINIDELKGIEALMLLAKLKEKVGE